MTINFSWRKGAKPRIEVSLIRKQVKSHEDAIIHKNTHIMPTNSYKVLWRIFYQPSHIPLCISKSVPLVDLHTSDTLWPRGTLVNVLFDNRKENDEWRMLHGGAWIWILCSSSKNNISRGSIKHKIYIFEVTCSFLFIISIIDIQGKDWKAGCN